jgi:hypothetical protein
MDPINVNISNMEFNYATANISNVKFQIMSFLFNALENGWSIKKNKGSYVFTKNHENKKEMFSEDYLTTFVREHFNTNKLLV